MLKRLKRRMKKRKRPSKATSKGSRERRLRMESRTQFSMITLHIQFTACQT